MVLEEDKMIPQYKDAYGNKCVSKQRANGHHLHQSIQVK